MLLSTIAPLIFWLMGTVVIIFLRPRDERWLVLVLFSYSIALWIAAGIGQRAGWAALVFHAVIWFFLPLAVHLHTILPSELFGRRTRRILQISLYAVSALLAVLDALFLLEKYVYSFVWYTLAAILLSLVLLCLRLVLPAAPATRIAVRIMLFGVTLGLVPFVAFHGLLLVWFKHMSMAGRGLYLFGPYMVGIALATMPILPMSYIYAIYKHHLGALEFRANRLLGIYTFSALLFASYTMTFFALSGQLAGRPRADFLAILLLVSLLYMAAVPLLRDRFQALVDRHVFGIKHSAEEVIGIVSARIPTAFDREVLARVVAEEILPTLLIRQSALYLFEEGQQETLYEQAVPGGEPKPTEEELRAAARRRAAAICRRDPATPRSSWVRLVIPLVLQAQTIGVWLIGRRDPDDYFPASDIHLLSTVANQIAPMAENVRLYEKAQQEIAQRKAAEEEIRRSEERFRTLFEATLEGIAIVRNGVILEVNHALLAIFGCPPDEILGRRLADLVDRRGGPRGSAAGERRLPARRHAGGHRDRRQALRLPGRGGVGGRHPRHRPAQERRGREQDAPAPAPALAEDGGHRPPLGRRRPRLQQLPARHLRLQRPAARALRRRPLPRPQPDRAQGGGPAGGGAHQAAPRLRPPPADGDPGDEPQRRRLGPREDAAAAARRGHPPRRPSSTRSSARSRSIPGRWSR